MPDTVMSQSNIDVFVIGSGENLNYLSVDERLYIQSCPTISLNRYIIFYDYIGIIPDHNIYLDNNRKTFGVLHHMSDKIKKNNLSTRVYFSSDIFNGYYGPGEHMPARKDFIMANFSNYTELKSTKNQSEFATHIDDNFFQTTTLGCGINLARVLYGDEVNIKCIGISTAGVYNTNFYTNLLKYIKNNQPDEYNRLADLMEHDLVNKHSSFAFNPILGKAFSDNRAGIIRICNQTSDLLKYPNFIYDTVLRDM